MSLKRVDLVRNKIAKEFAAALLRIRTFISYTEGNQEAVERLRNTEVDEETGRSKPGSLDELLADLTDRAMRHCGHEPEGFVRNPRGVVTRGAKRAARAVRG